MFDNNFFMIRNNPFTGIQLNQPIIELDATRNVLNYSPSNPSLVPMPSGGPRPSSPRQRANHRTPIRRNLFPAIEPEITEALQQAVSNHELELFRGSQVLLRGDNRRPRRGDPLANIRLIRHSENSTPPTTPVAKKPKEPIVNSIDRFLIRENIRLRDEAPSTSSSSALTSPQRKRTPIKLRKGKRKRKDAIFGGAPAKVNKIMRYFQPKNDTDDDDDAT